MQDKYLFEYAVIRVVPRVEREEFINVGVIMYCAKKKYLSTAIHLSTSKLLALDGKLDITLITENLKAFIAICEGGKAAGPIGLLETPERFRWLTATRSTVLQCSKVHPGFCLNPQETLQKLILQLVF